MNLMELLQLVDARLGPLTFADESELQAVLEEVAAGPRPVNVVPDAEPRTVLAVQLMRTEQACRGLRTHLGVELTVAARIDVKILPVGPADPGLTPERPHEPEQAE